MLSNGAFGFDGRNDGVLEGLVYVGSIGVQGFHYGAPERAQIY